jgi:hypothetical protein
METDNTGFGSGSGKGKGKGKGGGKGGSGGTGAGKGDTICRDFAKNGQCRYGDQCHFRHDSGGAATHAGGSAKGGGAKGGGAFGGGGGGGGGPFSNVTADSFGAGVFASNSPFNTMGQPQAHLPQQQAQPQAYLFGGGGAAGAPAPAFGSLGAPAAGNPFGGAGPGPQPALAPAAAAFSAPAAGGLFDGCSPQQSSPPQQGAVSMDPMSDDQLRVLWSQDKFYFGQIPETPPPDGLK